MDSPKTLRRPANWQDFENLCKKLWGEIWHCPEIQKNGRGGQEQFGVDIYGIPKNESEYFGIQCKGKSEYNYNHPQFTEKELQEEITKALNFLPKLKKLYFATTALNDAKIQTFVRTKNIEHIKLGLFEVHLFCWESIVDLIDENKVTHDWYINSNNFRSNYNAVLTFGNGEDTLNCKVPFQKTYTKYAQKIVPANAIDAIRFQSMLINDLDIKPFSLFNSKINKSYCIFFFRLYNLGKDAIENYKIRLKFSGEYQELDTVSKAGHYLLPQVNYSYDTFIYEDKKSGVIEPESKILVGEDNIAFDDIKLKPVLGKTTIIIDWTILSNGYKNQGQLTLNLETEILTKHKTILVSDPLKVRIDESEIEDYIEDSSEN